MAWANADNAAHVRGRNCSAVEYRIIRVLCDARIPNAFERASGIQAKIFIRGLLASVSAA